MARPVGGSARHAASTRSRACWRSGSAGCSAPGSARAAGRRLFLPERLQRLHLRDHRRGVRVHRRRRRDRAVPPAGLRWHPRRRCRRPTRSARCSPPGSPPGCASRRSSTSRVVVALVPITGITLPFISAGGSSLIISFAAVGILLSISRETVEKGTWNDDATADRGRGHGRAHLPGSRRRPVAAALTPATAAAELSWVGGHRGLEGSARPGGRDPAAPAGRCARCARSSGTSHAVLDPLRLRRPCRRPRRSSPRAGPRRSSRPAATSPIPVLLAAAPLRIPVVLWEGNVVPGALSGRTARLADVIAVSFEATCAALAGRCGSGRAT